MSRKFYQTLPPHTLSATSTAARVKLTQPNAQLEITARVVNLGDKPVYLLFGGPDVEAETTTGIAIPASTTVPELLNLPQNYTHLSYICAGSDTTTVQVTLGRLGK
jgi:hypothetical protein